MVARLRLLLAALWLGGLAAVGAIGAPTAFAIVPEKMIAATVASRMFAEMALAALVFGGVLLVIERARATTLSTSGPFALVAAALVFDVIGEWGVVPRLLSAAAVHAPDAMLWHGLASAVYLGQLICVGVYVWRLASAPVPAAASS